MNAVEQKRSEVGEAKSRARDLLNRGYSRDEAAKRMAGEFHICVYATHSGVYGSWSEKEGREERVLLAK